MAVNETTPRLYTDLAWLWPMWGDHEGEYADYCNFAVELIRQFARRPLASLLDISCGGGKNVFNLKQHFQVTGLDISPVMLDLAHALNPECEFLQGDMRCFELDRKFDAILMDDGVSYLTSRDELRAAFDCAFHHLEAGGVMIITADVTAENFQNRTHCTEACKQSKPPGVEVVFIENIHDPNPADNLYEATMIYLIRKNGEQQIKVDRHTLGLFSLKTWREILLQAGFVIHEVTYTEGESEYTTFACVRPS